MVLRKENLEQIIQPDWKLAELRDRTEVGDFQVSPRTNFVLKMLGYSLEDFVDQSDQFIKQMEEKGLM